MFPFSSHFCSCQKTARECVDRKQSELLSPPQLPPQTVAWFSHRPSNEHLTGIYEVMGNEVAAMLKIHNSGPVGNITPRIEWRPPRCYEVWNGSVCPSQLSTVIKTLIKTAAPEPRPYQADEAGNLQLNSEQLGLLSIMSSSCMMKASSFFLRVYGVMREVWKIRPKNLSGCF